MKSTFVSTTQGQVGCQGFSKHTVKNTYLMILLRVSHHVYGIQCAPAIATRLSQHHIADGLKGRCIPMTLLGHATATAAG